MADQITPNPLVPTQVIADGLKFPKFVTNLGIIPTSYKDSMSYYETLAWLCKYLEDTVIPTVNQNGEAAQELQNLYIQLEEYCENYFENLDVQEEINNKLDEMVSSGELQILLSTQYAQLRTEVFNELLDMKEKENVFETQTHVALNNLDEKIEATYSGSPSGVYDTLEDLTTDDPDHNKIYVVSANGNWYYYDNTNEEWVSGGVYQASEDSETLENLETLVDNLCEFKITNNIVPHIGYYIIINDESQNPKGSEIDANNIQFACSDYIEIPKGTVRLVTNCNEAYGQTSRAGWATYDENKTCLYTGNGATPINFEGASYVRLSNFDTDGTHTGLFVYFTIEQLGDTVYLLNNYVTPKMYGAVGDGKTDDTKAFQDALDSGYDVYVPCNKGEIYKITDTLVMNEAFTFHKLFGDCNPNQNFNNEGIIFSNLVSNRNKPLFDIRCSGVHLYGLSFNSLSFSTYWNKTFITTENYAQADKDINIEHCYINGFRTGVKFNGRGIQFKHCLLGGIYKLIEASWITTGETGQQGDDYGMRAIEISDNRIHNVKILVDLLSGNAQGMRICNNMCDNGICQVINSASDVDNISIVDNYFLNVHSESTGAVIDFSSNDIKNSIISNNHFVYDSDLLEAGMTECEKFMSVDEFYNSQLVNNIIYCASVNIVDSTSINKSIITLNNFNDLANPIVYDTKTNSIVDNNIGD